MFVRLTELRPVTARDTLYRFTCPAIARAALPGQFVELKLTGGCDPFLRRPISLFDADGTETFSLLVRTVGRGTEYMTGWTPGMEIDVLGPLGSGFSWETDTRDCLLVAGGIGLAPMGFLARRLLDEGKRVRLLFSPRRDAALLDALPFRERLDVSCCENRSALPAALDALLAQGANAVFSCGPEGLLESVAERAAAHGVPCQLSMERRMACGIGICLGCAIAIHTPGGVTYKKVCKDGPVFRGEEVAFHAQP